MELTTEEQNEWFIAAINGCSSKLLEENDDDVLGTIYEDFEGDARSVLYIDTLKSLLDGGFIDSEILELGLAIRKKFLLLIDEEDRTIENIRTSPDWKDLFSMCDKIIDLKRKFDSKK